MCDTRDRGPSHAETGTSSNSYRATEELIWFCDSKRVGSHRKAWWHALQSPAWLSGCQVGGSSDSRSPAPASTCNCIWRDIMSSLDSDVPASRSFERQEATQRPSLLEGWLETMCECEAIPGTAGGSTKAAPSQGRSAAAAQWAPVPRLQWPPHMVSPGHTPPPPFGAWPARTSEANCCRRLLRNRRVPSDVTSCCWHGNV